MHSAERRYLKSVTDLKEHCGWRIPLLPQPVVLVEEGLSTKLAVLLDRPRPRCRCQGALVLLSFAFSLMEGTPSLPSTGLAVITSLNADISLTSVDGLRDRVVPEARRERGKLGTRGCKSRPLLPALALIDWEKRRVGEEMSSRRVHALGESFLHARSVRRAPGDRLDWRESMGLSCVPADGRRDMAGVAEAGVSGPTWP